MLFQNPVTVDNLPFLLGAAPAASCVRWLPGRPTRLHLVPRPHARGPNGAPLQARVFDLPPLFVFHVANGFERGTELVVDSIQYDSLPAVGREALAQQQVRWSRLPAPSPTPPVFAVVSVKQNQYSLSG